MKEYTPADSCMVDKYSEKLKKLVVFSAFQSVYPMVRMTKSVFTQFAFSFVFRYNKYQKNTEAACMAKIYSPEELNNLSKETLVAVILSMQEQLNQLNANLEPLIE